MYRRSLRDDVSFYCGENVAHHCDKYQSILLICKWILAGVSLIVETSSLKDQVAQTTNRYSFFPSYRPTQTDSGSREHVSGFVTVPVMMIGFIIIVSFFLYQASFCSSCKQADMRVTVNLNKNETLWQSWGNNSSLSILQAPPLTLHVVIWSFLYTNMKL